MCGCGGSSSEQLDVRGVEATGEEERREGRG